MGDAFTDVNADFVSFSCRKFYRYLKSPLPGIDFLQFKLQVCYCEKLFFWNLTVHCHFSQFSFAFHNSRLQPDNQEYLVSKTVGVVFHFNFN